MEGWQSFFQCGVVKVTSDGHECSRLMIQQSRHIGDGSVLYKDVCVEKKPVHCTYTDCLSTCEGKTRSGLLCGIPL